MANDPVQRLASMAGHNPYELRIRSVIRCEDYVAAAQLERELHEQFGAARMRGEWFMVTDELFDYMTKVATRWEPPKREPFVPRTREEVIEFFGLGIDD